MIPEDKRFTRFWTPPDDTPNEHSMTVNRAKKITKIFPDFYQDKIVLDAGCGWGNASKWIIFKDTNGGRAKEVVGMDVNPDVIQKNLGRLLPVEGLKFVQQNIYETTYPAFYFDVIVCTEVIEHMDTDELRMLLREWQRILKEDGRIWITTPKKRFDKKHYPDGNGSHWIEYNMDELSKIFEEGFFKIEKSMEDENLYILLKKA